jgi:hypothetical protein
MNEFVSVSLGINWEYRILNEGWMEMEIGIYFKCPTNYSFCPTNHFKCPTNYSFCPTNHFKCPTNHFLALNQL